MPYGTMSIEELRAYRSPRILREEERLVAQRPENVRARSRNRSLRQKYNIDQGAFDRLLEAQDFRCAMPDCRSDKPNSKIGWHIDHDHTTGKVRGILCHSCNVSLGYYERSKVRAAAFESYLNKEMN